MKLVTRSGTRLFRASLIGFSLFAAGLLSACGGSKGSSEASVTPSELSDGLNDGMNRSPVDTSSFGGSGVPARPTGEKVGGTGTGGSGSGAGKDSIPEDLFTNIRFSPGGSAPRTNRPQLAPTKSGIPDFALYNPFAGPGYPAGFDRTSINIFGLDGLGPIDFGQFPIDVRRFLACIYLAQFENRPREAQLVLAMSVDAGGILLSTDRQRELVNIMGSSGSQPGRLAVARAIQREPQYVNAYVAQMMADYLVGRAPTNDELSRLRAIYQSASPSYERVIIDIVAHTAEFMRLANGVSSNTQLPGNWRVRFRRFARLMTQIAWGRQLTDAEAKDLNDRLAATGLMPAGGEPARRWIANEILRTAEAKRLFVAVETQRRLGRSDVAVVNLFLDPLVAGSWDRFETDAQILASQIYLNLQTARFGSVVTYIQQCSEFYP